jgi:hypothetical protein
LFIFIEYGISAINNLTYSAVNRLVIVGSRSIVQLLLRFLIVSFK